MSENRLENIEKCVKHDLVHNSGMMLSVSYNEVNWLIEQAERVQELEFDCAAWKEAARINDEDLEQQNKRMREQLKLIISDTRCKEHEYVSVRHLIRKRAEGALEGGKDE